MGIESRKNLCIKAMLLMALTVLMTVAFSKAAAFAATNSTNSSSSKKEISVSVNSSNVTLSLPKTNATGYEIYRAAKKNGKYKKIGTTKKTTYTDKNLSKGTYYYKVREYTQKNGIKDYGKLSDAVTAKVTKAVSTSLDGYPYQDKDGNWHYKMKLNGSIIPVEADAILCPKDNEYNEILYPVSAILDYYGVSYYWNKKTGEFSTVVNGIEASRDPEDGNYMWFTNQTAGYGNCIIPKQINGVWYAPNYFFEHTIGATLDKISAGNEKNQQYIAITTGDFKWGKGSKKVEIRHWNESKQEYYTDSGVKYPISDGDSDSGSGSGSGSDSGSSGSESSDYYSNTITCPGCAGLGGKWEQMLLSYNPVTGLPNYSTFWKACSTCGGSGRIHK